MYSLNARDHFNCSPLLFSWPAPQNRCGQTEVGSGPRTNASVESPNHNSKELSGRYAIPKTKAHWTIVLTLFFYDSGISRSQLSVIFHDVAQPQCDLHGTTQVCTGPATEQFNARVSRPYRLRAKRNDFGGLRGFIRYRGLSRRN